MFNAQQWRRLRSAAIRENNVRRWVDDVTADIREANYSDGELSIRQVFQEFVEGGREILDSWSINSGGPQSGVRLRESNVDTGAFATIIGQFVYTRMLEAFQNPQFIGDRLVTIVPTSFQQERIPGASDIGDEAETIGEGQAYPMAGFGEHFIDTPVTTKRGLIVGVTKELLLFDRTGLVLQRARETSQVIAINREKRILDAVLGVTSSYRRNGASAVATYGDNSGTHDWDNLAASNALVDWTDVENAMLLLEDITDPDTGEPVVSMPTQLVVPGALAATAKRIVNATEIRYGDGASNTTQTISRNPLSSYTIETNPWVKARSGSASTWFFGDFKRAFYYMQNWAATAVQAPVNSELEFTHDIVERFKISERGVPVAVNPRCVVKCTA